MLYLEYHELLKKYKNAEKSYYSALDKKSRLLYLVEPHAVQIKEVVNHLSGLNPDYNYIQYTSQIEEVDKLINETRNNKDVLIYELNKKELVLKNSQDIYDKIYYFKYIRGKRVNEFYRLTNYSKRQVYNYINEIKKNLYKNETLHKIAQK